MESTEDLPVTDTTDISEESAEMKIPKESQTTTFAGLQPATSSHTTPKKDTPTKTEADLRKTSYPMIYSLSNLASTPKIFPSLHLTAPGHPRKVAQSDTTYSLKVIPKKTEESESTPTSSDASIKEPSKKKESQKSTATSTQKRRRSSVKQPTASLGLLELRLQQKQANAQSLALNKEYALQRQAAQAELRLQQQQAHAQAFFSKKGIDLQREEANARLNTMKATAAMLAMGNHRQRAPIVILHVNNTKESHKSSANGRIHRPEPEPVIPIYRTMSPPTRMKQGSYDTPAPLMRPLKEPTMEREVSRPRNIEHDIAVDPRREHAFAAAPRPEKPDAQRLYSTHRYLTQRDGTGDSERKEDTHVRKRKAAGTPPPLRVPRVSPKESKTKRLEVFRVDKDGEIHKTSERVVRLINSNPRSDHDHPSIHDHVASNKKSEKSTPSHGHYTAAIHTNRPIRASPTHKPHFRLKKVQVYPPHRVSVIAA